MLLLNRNSCSQKFEYSVHYLEMEVGIWAFVALALARGRVHNAHYSHDSTSLDLVKRLLSTYFGESVCTVVSL